MLRDGFPNVVGNPLESISSNAPLWSGLGTEPMGNHQSLMSTVLSFSYYGLEMGGTKPVNSIE